MHDHYPAQLRADQVTEHIPGLRLTFDEPPRRLASVIERFRSGYAVNSGLRRDAILMLQRIELDRIVIRDGDSGGRDAMGWIEHGDGATMTNQGLKSHAYMERLQEAVRDGHVPPLVAKEFYDYEDHRWKWFLIDGQHRATLALHEGHTHMLAYAYSPRHELDRPQLSDLDAPDDRSVHRPVQRGHERS